MMDPVTFALANARRDMASAATSAAMIADALRGPIDSQNLLLAAATLDLHAGALCDRREDLLKLLRQLGAKHKDAA